MIDATALVKAAQGLDPLPATVARGWPSLVVRPDWSLNEAAHLVEFDAALTGRLLRLANSAAMAGLAPVNTARDAIMRVGIGPALAFAAASGLRKQLKRALPEYGLSDGQLWRHSVASAARRRADRPAGPHGRPARVLHRRPDPRHRQDRARPLPRSRISSAGWPTPGTSAACPACRPKPRSSASTTRSSAARSPDSGSCPNGS